MKKNTSVSLSDFVDSIYTLKALTRYNNKFKIINESVAEHSFFVAVLVLKMYDDYNFNLKTALKMALIHDIPELHLSDVTHDVKKNFPKLAKEVLSLPIFPDMKTIDFLVSTKQIEKPIGIIHLEILNQENLLKHKL